MPPSDKIIVLDRDGVINRDSSDYIKSPDEFEPIPGSIQAIRLLFQNDFTVTVATNQSGLGRKLFDEDALTAIHQKLYWLAEAAGGAVSGIFYCPHKPDAGCDCRKPRTGLLQRIEENFHIPLAGKFFVGDSKKDLQAAIRFNMKPVLVRTGNGASLEKQLDSDTLQNLPVYPNLLRAVENLILHSHA